MHFFEQWQRVSLTDDESSWVARGRIAPLPKDEFEQLWAMAPTCKQTGVIYGKEVEFPRRICAYGQDYAFSGQVSESKPLSEAPGYSYYADWMTDVNLNGVLVNWYDAANGDYIGPHSDDERSLVSGAPIMSITWTSRPDHFRRFRLKPKNSAGLYPNFGDEPGVLKLYGGDVVVMGGSCQRTHKHEIMPPRKKKAPQEANGRRINITLRCFS